MTRRRMKTFTFAGLGISMGKAHSKVRFFGGNLKATSDFAKKAAHVA